MNDDIENIVKSVLETMEGDIKGKDFKVYAELEELISFIHLARTEIASLRPHEIREKDIPLATDELDAVVGATEEATGSILDCAEQIEKIVGDVPSPQKEQIQDKVTAIFEACSFQDITGQRITKVVKTLKTIENKIETLLHGLGDSYDRNKAAPIQELTDDEKLLNGPQLPGAANAQDDIDALLASFDK